MEENNGTPDGSRTDLLRYYRRPNIEIRPPISTQSRLINQPCDGIANMRAEMTSTLKNVTIAPTTRDLLNVKANELEQTFEKHLAVAATLVQADNANIGAIPLSTHQRSPDFFGSPGNTPVSTANSTVTTTTTTEQQRVDQTQVRLDDTVDQFASMLHVNDVASITAEEIRDQSSKRVSLLPPIEVESPVFKAFQIPHQPKPLLEVLKYVPGPVEPTESEKAQALAEKEAAIRAAEESKSLQAAKDSETSNISTDDITQGRIKIDLLFFQKISTFSLYTDCHSRQ